MTRPATTSAIRVIALSELEREARSGALAHEWLVTNGRGGYASGTIGGAPTRRYHGLLVASLPPPYGRRLLLADLVARVRLPDGTQLSLNDPDGGLLTEFRLEAGLPIWRYEHAAFALEKRVVLTFLQNTVHVVYDWLRGAEPIALELAIVAHNRSHDAPVDMPLPMPFALERSERGYEVCALDLPRLRLAAHGRDAALREGRRALPEVAYGWEQSRGYEWRAVPCAVGDFCVKVTRKEAAALTASTEAWDAFTALSPGEALLAERERRARLVAGALPAAREGVAAELVLAADQFVIKPAGRSTDAARVSAEGDEPRTVIAGYHWFTDWGRDTMISLEGLTLLTGRHAEARHILQTFVHALRDGLLPNLFPEGEDEGLYHTADATLWMFHAFDRYLAATDDRALLETMLPRLVDVAEHHLRGTRFGIGVDPSDGLLRQGAEGYQLTWMDAKVGDWVVTPRRGKAVEINALWYNALRLLERWLRGRHLHSDADAWARHAERARASFNRRFWNPRKQHLYDVVDGDNGDDAACRPNQVFAISLPNPALDPRHWNPTLEAVRAKLLTPFGLRSLAPDEPQYQPRYDGDIYHRDAAYHQGTVWAWLIGPFVDAWVKAHPADVEAASGFLDAFPAHLSEACVGTISEIFDAEPPYSARGCVAQAWSVAEVLRSWIAVRSESALNRARRSRPRRP
jgi:glycogen debranching enzyme